MTFFGSNRLEAVQAENTELKGQIARLRARVEELEKRPDMPREAADAWEQINRKAPVLKAFRNRQEAVEQISRFVQSWQEFPLIKPGESRAQWQARMSAGYPFPVSMEPPFKPAPMPGLSSGLGEA
jgi:hypothetical protein